MHRTDAVAARSPIETQLAETSKQIDMLVGRIMDASSPSVIGAYEKRIEELERQRIRLAEQDDAVVPSQGRLSEFIEPALAFLANHWYIYQNGSFALKRTVLKLAFAEPLRYSRNEGYRTAESAFPFKVLADFSTQGAGWWSRGGSNP